MKTKCITIKNEINSAINSLPEYSDHVRKLGIFIARKSDIDSRTKASEYTNFTESKPWISPHGNLMMNFFYKGVQSIVVFLEDYLKESDNNIQCILYHEMGHAICGHESRQVKSPGFIDKLPKKTAIYIKNHLVNFQEDYEVDVFLASKIPRRLLEKIYDRSVGISQNSPKRIIEKVPKWAQRI